MDPCEFLARPPHVRSLVLRYMAHRIVTEATTFQDARQCVLPLLPGTAQRCRLGMAFSSLVLMVAASVGVEQGFAASVPRLRRAVAIAADGPNEFAVWIVECGDVTASNRRSDK